MSEGTKHNFTPSRRADGTATRCSRQDSVGGGGGGGGQGGRQHLPRPSTGCPRSRRVTGTPASARASAANRPAGPLPTTTTASARAAAPRSGLLLLAVGSTSSTLPLDCASASSEGLQDDGPLASERSVASCVLQLKPEEKVSKAVANGL